MKGIFYGIGVGPGDPELLTVKAVNIIKGADVIITPRTEKQTNSIAFSIAEEYIQEKTEILPLVFPMVKCPETLNSAWENNQKIILDLLEQGKKVVFLTLGDPMLYSTYIYILKELKKTDCNIETIPGIPAFAAIASRLNYPLTEGDDILSIVPATNPKEALEKAFAESDNLVLMKVYKNYEQIIQMLKDYNYIDSAVMISNCGLENEEIVYDLREHEKEKPKYLSTILARKAK